MGGTGTRASIKRRVLVCLDDGFEVVFGGVSKTKALYVRSWRCVPDLAPQQRRPSSWWDLRGLHNDLPPPDNRGQRLSLTQLLQAGRAFARCVAPLGKDFHPSGAPATWKTPAQGLATGGGGKRFKPRPAVPNAPIAKFTVTALINWASCFRVASACLPSFRPSPGDVLRSDARSEKEEASGLFWWQPRDEA